MNLKLPLALLAITACVDSAEPADELELENGGFTTEDELATFGDEALFASAAIEADASEADTLASTELATMESATTAESYDLVVLWGRMPFDAGATEGRDWSGDLSVSRGGLRLRRRIGFEAATDRVMPRERPDRVDFRSVTRPFADGLAIRVIDDDRENTEAIRLRYTSLDGTVVHDLDLRRLDDGPVVVDAGDGNRIVAVGRRRRHDADPCANGVMRGRWHALAPNHGVFLGVVANDAGEPVGHVRGIYGQRRNGTPVVFGKFIARDGGFTGLINGTYGDERFAARWITRDGDHGAIHGAFFEGPSLRGGVFAARWAETSCAR